MTNGLLGGCFGHFNMSHHLNDMNIYMSKRFFLSYHRCSKELKWRGNNRIINIENMFLSYLYASYKTFRHICIKWKEIITCITIYFTSRMSQDPTGSRLLLTVCSQSLTAQSSADICGTERRQSSCISCRTISSVSTPATDGQPHILWFLVDFLPFRNNASNFKVFKSGP